VPACLLGMMRRLLIPIFVLATTTAAFAGTGTSTTPTAQDQANSDCARARKAHKTCVLNIEAEDVKGKGAIGDGTSVTALQHEKMGSLIRVRTDFRAEIIKSAENL
jgi:hypothetical protein